MEQLPEKWHIKVTKENREALGRWRVGGFLPPDFEDKLYLMSEYNSSCGWGSHSILAGYEQEITFEEFERLVLLKVKEYLIFN